MESLENRIREALIIQTAEETYQKMQEPKYKDKIREYVQKILSSAFGADELKEDEEGFKELMSIIEEGTEKWLNDPANLREEAYKSARNQYNTREQFDAQMEPLYKDLKKHQGFKPEALQEVKNASKELYDFFDTQTKLVTGLVKVAEEEGFERALTKEARCNVLKEMFPSSEEYTAYKLKSAGAGKNFLICLQKAIAKEDKEAEVFGKFIGGLAESLDDINEEMLKDIIDQEVKEIYG